MESKKVARFLLKFKLYTHIKSNEIDEIVNLIDKCGLEYDYFDDRITFLTLAVIQGIFYSCPKPSSDYTGLKSIKKTILFLSKKHFLFLQRNDKKFLY